MFKSFGVIGENLSHSLSPIIHDKFFKKTGILGTYNLFEVKREDLKDVVRALKVLGIKGANVTMPYKIDIMEYLDELSPEAEKIGAVNTITIADNKAIGSNTDYFGFGMALEYNGIELKGKVAAVLGTGGASRAVSQHLLDKGIRELIFVSRDPQRAIEKYRDFRIITYKELDSIDGDILVNCTPVGMYPNIDKSPVEAAQLKQFKVVVDIVYNPKQTLILKKAQELGLDTVNGMDMLVCQAAKAEELWNKITIDKNIIDEVLLEVEKEL